jgi:hypothetical protein
MLEISYIGLSVLMVLIIVFAYRNTLIKVIEDKKNRNRRMTILIGFLIFWFGYLTFLSTQELLFDLNLPPKIPILIFLPLIIITAIFYFNNKNDAVLNAIPKTYPVYYQTFRILVELLLLFTFYKNIIPETATFEGWNFDILMGITAPFMAYFVFRGNIKNLFLAKAWNILGIFMVLFVAFIIASGFYQPQIWGSETQLVKFEFVKMPYLLIAGFLAPSAIFMHLVSLMQLRK